jgi:hypothetical protein
VTACLSFALLVAAGVAVAQWYEGRSDRRSRRDRTSIPADRAGVPDWEIDEKHAEDVFTFVRIRYDSDGWGGRGWGRGGGRWDIDWPESDLNFSFRLQQLTSMKVNPEPIWMSLTDQRLFDYPFIYMLEVGSLSFSEPEVEALRRYLLSGGFLMVDDFWGDYEWDNFYHEIKRVFPDREPVELDIDHEIFRCVYRLKEKPQIPSIGSAWDGRHAGITWERGHGGNTEEVHFRAIFDDKDRMMAIICHNTDLGDGWEEEGVDPWYFKEFSEKKAYPMGINIVTYAMTH